LTYNIIFDKHIFFNGKPEDLSPQIITKINSLVARIILSKAQVSNKSLLEEDEEVLEPSHDENNGEFNDEEAVADFNEKKNYKLTQALEKALGALSISSSSESAFHIQLLVNLNNQDQEQIPCKTCSQGVEDKRFKDFDEKKILSIFHGAFAAGQQFKIHKRNLSSSSKTIQDLKDHLYRVKFQKAQEKHL
jgi:hypothetical protein